jgi:hypothetical protein
LLLTLSPAQFSELYEVTDPAPPGTRFYRVVTP